MQMNNKLIGTKIKFLTAAVLMGIFLPPPQAVNADDTTTLETTLGKDSAYSLKNSDSEDGNVITFRYDEKTGTIQPVYYALDIKRESQGTGNSVQYYEWKKDEYGGDILVATKEETSYAVHYDNDKDYYDRKTSPVVVTSGQTHDDIIADFIGNHITDSGSNYGNGIYNRGTINNVVGDFVHNYSTGKGEEINNGGSIYNSEKGRIEHIKGNFIGNFITANSDSNGGAIRNGDQSTSTETYIGTINGSFISNYARSTGWHNGYGGAIYNINGTINEITGDFIDNQANSGRYADGGAIFNGGGNKTKINKITGDFVGNKAIGFQGQGGAIFDISGIKEIHGNFIHNFTHSNGDLDVDDSTKIQNVPVNAQGGAIYAFARTGSSEINGDFYGNYAQADYHEGQGGAIYANVTGTNTFTLNSNFYHNYTKGKDGAKGGAIFNAANSKIILNGNYYFANISETESGNALGGAIYNNGEISGLKNVSFIQNYAKSVSGEAKGGAIYTAKDLTITADKGKSEFRNNFVESSNRTNEAIFVDGSNTLTLNSINDGTILFDDIINGTSGYSLKMTGDNSSEIILNNNVINANATIENVTLTLGANPDIFKDSELNVKSGIINTANSEYTEYNMKKLTSGEGKYNIDIALSKDAEHDKADTFKIFDGANSSGYIDLSAITVSTLEKYEPGIEEEHIIQIIKTENGNTNLQLKLNGKIKAVKEATAIMTNNDILAQEIGICTTDTENDSIKVVGWRDNLAAWAELETDDGKKTFTILDGATQVLSRYIDNLSGEDIKIIGSESATLDVNGKNLFENIEDGQFVSLSDLSLINADNVNNNGDLTLETVTLESSSVINNNKNLLIKGKTDLVGTVKSEIGGNLNIEDANVNIIGKVENQKITNSNSDTTLENVADFKGNSLLMKSGNFNIIDLGLNNLQLNNFELHDGNINIERVDVDLANKKMGRISSSTYSVDENFSGNINVKDLNLLSDSQYMTTAVLFADADIKDYVLSDVKQAPTNGQNWEAFSPIYKYNVEYSTNGQYGDGGYFVFSRGNSATGNSSDGFNPAVLPSSVASKAGGYAAVNETFNYAFEHADTFSVLPSIEKFAMLNANKYSITEVKDLKSYSNEINHNSAWVKPYATFESIPLKNGPDVDTITYGTLVGTDGDIKELKHGWATVSTAYIGYNGSNQHYKGVDTTQNGGLLGLTQTFYRNNFYSALTASVGAAVGESSTMYGNEDFSMLLSGLASKSGYSFEFNEGKFIIQPTLLVAYTFVNTFDYTNAAGVRIDSDPLHTIQVYPKVKFVANLENGWQPYISAGVVYNVMDKTEVNAINGATDVRLPNMSVKPYAEYGVGIQKRWKDKYTGYAQAMARSGGRNGVALTFGFRWTLGDNDKIEKVDSKPKKHNKFINKIAQFFGEYFSIGNAVTPINNTKKYL